MDTLKIGGKVKKLRELRNYTQDYMADALQMSQAGYGKIERDETDISLSRLQQIAGVLQVGLLDILGFDEKMMFIGAMTNHSTANGLVVQQKDNFDAERKLYDEQIRQLKDQIAELNKHLERALTN